MKNLGLNAFGEAEHVDGAIHTHLGRLNRIELIAVILLTTGILNPAGVAIALERKSATRRASVFPEVNSIAVLLFTLNEPVFAVIETGIGTMLIEAV